MKLTVNTDLLAATEELGPLIREYAGATEQARRPARPVMDALGTAGLFRLFTPRSLGGLEVDPITFAQVLERVAGFDSAAGWALMTGNSSDWWCSRLPDQGAEELYAGNPNAILAAAFHPPVPAREVDGGYRLTGQRPLASNIHDADWVLLTALVMDGEQPKLIDGVPQVVGALFPAREARIVDTWYSLGMRGTDSNDVAVENVFVPYRRTFPLRPEFTRGRHYQGPLYRIPGMGEVAVIMAPMFLAMARGAVDVMYDIAQGKTPFGSARLLKERPVAQMRLAQAEGTLRAARALFYDTLSEAWQQALASSPFSLEQKADLLLSAVHTVCSGVQVVDLVYSIAGTSGIYARNPLERYFRDIHTLRHHGFTAESRYEAVGQVYLGVPPEFGFISF